MLVDLRRPRSLGAVACDPFWTDLNGGVCSDEFGNYLRSDGTPVEASEIVASVTGRRADPIAITRDTSSFCVLPLFPFVGKKLPATECMPLIPVTWPWNAVVTVFLGATLLQRVFGGGGRRRR